MTFFLNYSLFSYQLQMMQSIKYRMNVVVKKKTSRSNSMNQEKLLMKEREYDRITLVPLHGLY